MDMDTRIAPTQPDVVTVSSEPRPTQATAKFSEVMATGAAPMVGSAEAAMTVLPGSPVTALAVRGPTSGLSAAPGLAMGPPGLGGIAPSMAAEGPGAVSGMSPAAAIGATLAAGLPGALMGDGGIQATLLQSQQMNLYYLQLQQQVDAQNRSFSTLSNVLKSENDTEKNAIGNMH